ncbi:hypothetical protein CPC08DRAFT_824681 [Agrocybe pediades]|nr:hypothetical protein CPC08DRAFT_824681 [Agrocybe pediades]
MIGLAATLPPFPASANTIFQSLCINRGQCIIFFGFKITFLWVPSIFQSHTQLLYPSFQLNFSFSFTQNNMSNPRPTGVLSHRCPKCGNLSLTALTQCNGGGKFVENWGRWYQICAIPTCKHFVWHNPPTPLDKIPERVLEAFEHKEAAQALGVLKCSQVNCLSTSNTRRKANKLCPNKACASCCRVLGGCQLPQHRPEDALSVEAERLTATSDGASCDQVLNGTAILLYQRCRLKTILFGPHYAGQSHLDADSDMGSAAAS